MTEGEEGIHDENLMDNGNGVTSGAQFVVLVPLRLLGARYMPRLRNTLDADERFWVTTGLGKTWTAKTQ